MSTLSHTLAEYVSVVGRTPENRNTHSTPLPVDSLDRRWTEWPFAGAHASPNDHLTQEQSTKRLNYVTAMHQRSESATISYSVHAVRTDDIRVERIFCVLQFKLGSFVSFYSLDSALFAVQRSLCLFPSSRATYIQFPL